MVECFLYILFSYIRNYIIWRTFTHISEVSTTLSELSWMLEVKNERLRLPKSLSPCSSDALEQFSM